MNRIRLLKARTRPGHWSWCALTDDKHPGPCEAVAEMKTLHSQPRPEVTRS